MQSTPWFTFIVVCLAIVSSRADALGWSISRDRATTRAEARFVELDADRNGALSQDEFRTQFVDLFTTLDKNDDGKLDLSEAKRLVPQLGNGGRMTWKQMLALADQRFAYFDTDRDQSITQTEFLVGRLTEFDEADANGDGRLNLSELRKARQ